MRMPRLRDPEGKLTKRTDYYTGEQSGKRDLDSGDILKRWEPIGENGPNFLKPHLDTVLTGRKPKANDKDHKHYPQIKE